MNDDFIALIEIVDALCGEAAALNPNNSVLKSIADRARRLYRRSVENPDTVETEMVTALNAPSFPPETQDQKGNAAP